MEGVVFYGKGEMLSVTIKNPSLLLPYSDLVPAKPLLINSLAHRGGAHASGLPSSICFTAAAKPVRKGSSLGPPRPLPPSPGTNRATPTPRAILFL